MCVNPHFCNACSQETLSRTSQSTVDEMAYTKCPFIPITCILLAHTRNDMKFRHKLHITSPLISQIPPLYRYGNRTKLVLWLLTAPIIHNLFYYEERSHCVHLRLKLHITELRLIHIGARWRRGRNSIQRNFSKSLTVLYFFFEHSLRNFNSSRHH